LPGHSAFDSSAWQREVFDSGGLDLGPITLGNGLDNHVRIARGPEDNLAALEYIDELVRASE